MRSPATLASSRVAERAAAVQRTQAIFTKQLRGRLEVARALALPQYQSSGEPSDLARAVIQAEAANIQQLMQTVSSMTSRSANFQKLMQEEGAARMSERQLNRIHDLDLSIIPQPERTMEVSVHSLFSERNHRVERQNLSKPAYFAPICPRSSRVPGCERLPMEFAP